MELLVDGQRVFAATGGPQFSPQRPALVLVHGAGFDRTVWVLQTRYFAHRGFGVLAVDLPGHGRSEGDPLRSIDEIADWLAKMIEAAGVSSAALVGHSMGALGALATAARYPELVGKLALLGVSASMSVHPELLEAAQANDQLAIDLMIGWSFGSAAHRGGHLSPGNWMMGVGRRTLERAGPGVLHSDLVACATFSSGQAMAAAVQCPTLLILGQEDKMTPVHAAQNVIEAIADVTVEVLPAVGHMMMTEHPRLTNSTLHGFLAA